MRNLVRIEMSRGMTLAALVLFSALGPSCFGDTLRVPTQHSTIQSAIEVARDHDTILVASGIYVEDIDFLGKRIEVLSELGPSWTTIQLVHSGIQFINDENEQSRLEGFKILGTPGTYIVGFGACGGGCLCVNTSPVLAGNIWSQGIVDGFGGAIFAINGSPLIDRNVFTENSASRGGGAMGLIGGMPVVRDNHIHHNTTNPPIHASGKGGGLYCKGCQSIEVHDNRFHHNTATISGGGIHTENAFPQIFRNQIRNNTAGGTDRAGGGGGLSCLGRTLICWNTIEENQAHEIGGGGAWVHDSEVDVIDNLFRGNRTVSALGFGLGAALMVNTGRHLFRNNTCVENQGLSAIYVPYATVAIEQSILWNGLIEEISVGSRAQVDVNFTLIAGNYPGQDNLDLDPQFKSPQSGDYRLSIGSPAIESGDPSFDLCMAKDLSGGPRLLSSELDGYKRVDRGCYEFNHIALEMTADATPGGWFQADVNGTPGIPAKLVIGTSPGAMCHGQTGPLYFSGMTPYFIVDWGRIPHSGRIPIPPDAPTPLWLVFQAVARDVQQPAGNVSEPIEFVIE